MTALKTGAAKDDAGHGADTRAAAAYAVDQVLAGGRSLDTALNKVFGGRVPDRARALV